MSWIRRRARAIHSGCERRSAGSTSCERPIAATMLIERMKPASDEERLQTLAVLREAGAVDSLMHSTARGLPWRRALATRTLGWIGADETVPVLIERLSDRNRYVRESAVRALGRIGDSARAAVFGGAVPIAWSCRAGSRL